MSKFQRVPIIATALFSVTFSAWADSIGVNVGPNHGANEVENAESTINNELPIETIAGIIPQANWNNLLEGNFGITQLIDDNGTLLETTASVSTRWVNGVSGHGSTDGDQILMNGGLDGDSSNVLSSMITGIPYSNYDVYIYFDGGNDNGRGGTYSATPSGEGASEPQSQDGYDLATFSGEFIQATGTGLDDEGNPVGSNYVKFSGMSGENLEIASVPIAHSSGVSRAPWNGFQIVEVGVVAPEITEIQYSPVDHMLTLTWKSKPGDSYAVESSADLNVWDLELDDNVSADEEGETTTMAFDLLEAGIAGSPRLFFRVERL